MPLVVVGRIGRAHGVNGEVALDGVSLTPLELHEVNVFTWRGRAGEERTLKLATARPAHTRLLVRFEGIAGRDQASALTNGELLVESDRLPDPGPGTAYTFQLIGLRVETEDGRALGTLEDIVATGAHPVYVVQGERELLIPATPEVVRRVDLAAGVIAVALPAGLEEIF
ncbi:MAG: 16S rRNA processing protein RimM [Candidatus Eisenbacteria bacterium]|nr:16S rRNA processing protein RimM [Candidatus Eisenbacteria bacterium]